MTGTSWARVVRIGRAFTDEDLLFETRRDLALDALRTLPPNDELDGILAELAAATDIAGFDEIWIGRMYPWADRHRVWIDVFSE